MNLSLLRKTRLEVMTENLRKNDRKIQKRVGLKREESSLSARPTPIPWDLCPLRRSSQKDDRSGHFVLQVGFGAKSGVSGAVMAVMPHRMGFAVCCSALDVRGNSVAGLELLHRRSIQRGIRVP